MTLSSGRWRATRLAVAAGVVLMLSTAHLPARAAGDSLAPGSRAATHIRVGLTTDPACTRVDDSPSGLTATVSGATVTLQWIAPYGCTPASYVVLAGSGPNLSNLADFSTGNSATTLTVNGVAAGIYYVRVLALAGSVRTSASNEVAIAVGIACDLPAAPLALSATATPSSASLEWDAAAGSPTSYVIEAGSAPGLTNLVINGAAGKAGTATLTVTLAAFDDYDVSLSIVGTGAILVDDFQLIDVATGAAVTETAETLLRAP